MLEVSDALFHWQIHGRDLPLLWEEDPSLSLPVIHLPTSNATPYQDDRPNESCGSSYTDSEDHDSHDHHSHNEILAVFFKLQFGRVANRNSTKFFTSSFYKFEKTPDTNNINNHAPCVPLNFLTLRIYVYRMNDGIFSKDQPSKNCTS